MQADSKSAGEWRVICLCAAWCGVCRDWLPTLREVQAARPDVAFAWIDVEDEDEAMGEVDIVTFPTVLVAQGREARFLGPVPPFGKQLLQLLDRLQAQAQPASAGVQADALLARLQPLLARASL